MRLKPIFRTKLDNNGNYQGFESLDSEILLSAEDLIKLKDVERKIYNSQSHLEEEEIMELSVGLVIIKGSIHPFVGRRKMIEGFIEIEDVIEQVPEPLKVDTRAKEYLISSLKNLFALRQTTNKEKFIAPQIEYLLERLENESVHIEGCDLVNYSVFDLLKDKTFKEDQGMKDMITCIQSNMTMPKTI